ncbi:MAG: tetratricopeptide repeat protein [Acidobacteriota bacterium]|nr:tetratricopeptide repeat protein [Acidobacteriota bacterium]
MSAKSIRRKDLKHDELVSLTGRATQWLAGHGRRIGWLLLVLALVVSIVLGVRFAHQRQENRAAELLAAAMEIFRAPVILEPPAASVNEDEKSADESAVDIETPEASGTVLDGSTNGPVVCVDPAISGLRFATEAEKCRASLDRLEPIVERYANLPSGRMAAFYSGDCHVRLGSINEAIAAFSQAIEARGSLVSAMALYRLGQLERERDNAEAAVAYFDRLLGVSRNLFPREEALIAKARAYQEGGDARAALTNYQKVVEEFGDSYIAGEARAQISELSVQLGLDPDIEGN